MAREGFRQMYEYGTTTPPHCRDREETGVIRPGAHVRIVGLATRQDLNGAAGVVKDYSYAKGRWAVQTEATAVQVKPDNLRVNSQQPAGVQSAHAYLQEITPPGMQFSPKMPPSIFGAGLKMPPSWPRAPDRDEKADAHAARMQTLKCGLHVAGASPGGSLDDLPEDLRTALVEALTEPEERSAASPQSVTATFHETEETDEEGEEEDDDAGSHGEGPDLEEDEVTAREMYQMALQGNLACIKMLLECGCPVDAALSDPPRGMPFMGGSTALHGACIDGHLDVVNELLRAGANLDARRHDDRRTPLHEACKEGHEPCALRLVAAGAKTDIKDMWGLTPCALAEQKGHRALAKKVMLAPRGKPTQAAVVGAYSY